MTGLSSFDFRQIIMTNVLKINPADNVVVAIQPQPAGAVIEVDGQKINESNTDTDDRCATEHAQFGSGCAVLDGRRSSRQEHSRGLERGATAG